MLKYYTDIWGHGSAPAESSRYVCSKYAGRIKWLALTYNVRLKSFTHNVIKQFSLYLYWRFRIAVSVDEHKRCVITCTASFDFTAFEFVYLEDTGLYLWIISGAIIYTNLYYSTEFFFPLIENDRRI